MSTSIRGLGKLTPDSKFPKWLYSEKIKVNFFDDKELPFIVTMGDKLNNILIEKIESAINNFLHLDAEYRKKISNLVYENYKQTLEEASDVTPLKIKEETDIWKYVRPQEIHISQRQNIDKKEDKDIYIKVWCDCDWEEEHGLQLVFKKGERITMISQQNRSLTTADAYGIPDSEDKLLSNSM